MARNPKESGSQCFNVQVSTESGEVGAAGKFTPIEKDKVVVLETLFLGNVTVILINQWKQGNRKSFWWLEVREEERFGR